MDLANTSWTAAMSEADVFAGGDLVCTICETSGVLDTCDGCARAWHVECLLDDTLPGTHKIPPGKSRPPSDPDEPWLCDECELRIHRCGVCKEFGRDEGMLRCPVTSCSRWYHNTCLRGYFKATGFRPRRCPANPAVVEEFCPRHFCCGRERGECTLGKDAAALRPEWRCVRCSVSYHAECKPMDMHVLSFESKTFVCVDHFSNKLPSLDPALLAGRKRFKLSSKAPGISSVPADMPDSNSALAKSSKLSSKDAALATTLIISDTTTTNIIQRKRPSPAPKPKGPKVTKLKGTRMKIKGFDPSAVKKSVSIKAGKRETYKDRKRRLGLTGEAVGGGIAKRGSKARLGMMKWAREEMEKSAGASVEVPLMLFADMVPDEATAGQEPPSVSRVVPEPKRQRLEEQEPGDEEDAVDLVAQSEQLGLDLGGQQAQHASWGHHGDGDAGDEEHDYWGTGAGSDTGMGVSEESPLDMHSMCTPASSMYGYDVTPWADETMPTPMPAPVPTPGLSIPQSNANCSGSVQSTTTVRAILSLTALSSDEEEEDEALDDDNDDNDGDRTAADTSTVGSNGGSGTVAVAVASTERGDTGVGMAVTLAVAVAEESSEDEEEEDEPLSD